jgi:hypothetical protein
MANANSSSGQEPAPNPDLKRFKCGNCDDHVSQCFADPIKTILKSAAAEAPDHDPGWYDKFLRYFDPVDNPGQHFKRGDVVLWGGEGVPQKHHIAIATGQGHSISQNGLTIQEWNAVFSPESPPTDSHDNVLDADELSAFVAREQHGGTHVMFGNYTVYRLNAESMQYLLCRHLISVTLNLNWEDNGEKHYVAEEPGTYWPAVRFKLTGVTARKLLNSPGDQEWTAAVHSRGKRTFYSCRGWKQFSVQANELDEMTAEELRATAQTASELKFYEFPSMDPSL